MKTEFYLLGYCGVAAVAALYPSNLRADGWWLEAGPVWRGGLSVSVDNSVSYAQRAGLLGTTGWDSVSASVGPLNEYADRLYDNGYVKRDRNTGSTVYPNDPNTTWNWGGGQYANGYLSFSKQGSVSAATADEEMLGMGLQLLGGLPLKQWKKWSLDISLGFQGVWGGEANLNQDVNQTTVTDRYDVSTLNPADLIGYQGTYEGAPYSLPFSPTPVIPNLPTDRSTLVAANVVAFKVNQSFYQFSLGPQIGFAVNEHFQLKLRPTLSLNLMDVQAQRTETFGPTTWFNQTDKSQVAFGLGITGGADLNLGKGFYTGVFGGYEWVTDKLKVSVGPNTVSVDGSGFVAGAVFGKRF